MNIPKIGMRTIKTAVAVSLCTVAGSFIVENPMYAGIGCLVSIQDTVKGSLKLGFNRIKGTVLGGIIGYICIILSPNNPILSAIGTILIIQSCNKFKINSGLIVSMVTFLSIHTGVIDNTPEIYAIRRVFDTMIGVFIGNAVNVALVPPKYLEKTLEHTSTVEETIEKYIVTKIINKKEFDLKNISREVKKLETMYGKLENELSYRNNTDEIENINNKLILAKKLYHHTKSIDLLEEKLYISTENYNLIKKIYKTDNLNWEVSNTKSPVFNYHLKSILDINQDIQEIHKKAA